MVSTTSSYNITSSIDNPSATSAATTSTTTAEQDRFLTLLVAQLNNQDPLNPMDNAEMTTQIAQINTVTGIQKLNDTVSSITSQFSAMQMMQGGSMIGHEVLAAGSALTVDADTHTGSGAFDLAGDAASVSVQVVNASGQVIGTEQLGSLGAGRHEFTWDTSAYTGPGGSLSFKVVAANGTTSVDATTLMRDKVVSVGAQNGTVQLQLEKSGYVDYTALKAVL
ncbi:flagellar hook capping FlgD N-terminal domain-containing protein [Ramlibacter sp. H39-3-26]|uniref:flagellar hook assembly protein FlgD n=1 Tax=Curvibacter soli TaxID=3031331 RepID=UPI0023DA1F23|nr:flagellar hook capping FlgD N-terminal domain-containing protein [Ramlibacter sp. H39-3-26]MDF1485802.1 flagellar hook capping FlgD N-terminal domain-containing protein [Ramlibacter sp. H39-3-26]